MRNCSVASPTKTVFVYHQPRRVRDTEEHVALCLPVSIVFRLDLDASPSRTAEKTQKRGMGESDGASSAGKVTEALLSPSIPPLSLAP